jgi:hypothetical protein
MIKHLHHTEIDKQRWDACIDGSANPLPYAYSWWLDTVCPGWDALVQDDYVAVMPLTRNTRFGVDYLYQPYFTQQLGVFSQQDSGIRKISDFLNGIPDSYRYIDIRVNADNLPDHPDFLYTSRKNCTLDLSPDYIQLATGYHRNCRRNIQKALHAGLSVKTGPGPSVFTSFIRRNLDNQLTRLRKSFYPILQQIVQTSIQKGTGEIKGIFNPRGDLVAAAWFVLTPGRYTFLVCASTAAGKENQAMFLLVDHAIREKAGTGLLFDFAGSNMPGIAYFNLGFDARESFYPALKRNLLPWPLSRFKK